MDSNPWSDQLPVHHSPPHTPDPDLLDNSITANAFTRQQTPQPTDHLLTEFDPLVSPEEQAAREAWQTAEAHPPHTPPSPPIVPPTRSLSPFPSLASLAKTFSLPNLNLTRPRPISMDAAHPVLSPSTLSSMAALQRSSPIEEPHEAADGGSEPPESPGEQVELQFDFQNFLDQMKSRSAEPVSKYLRSFLSAFAKRSYSVGEQVRIIGDFLNFIAGHMRNCEVWRNASEAEFDNALEGMEKLVMNRLYDFTFTPQVALAVPPRRYNPDDLERDRVLAQRISLFGWVEETHLDVPVGEGSEGFISFAVQELVKINHYKAPRDKLICVLNCCKVIFGLIRHLKKDEGADSFVPLLIFVVLKANPPHLLSNVEFINRFRNPTKLQGEPGYYLSSLIGAISFIETMDHTSLSNITKEEFEKNVETAIQALPASGSAPVSPITTQETQPPFTAPTETPSPHAGEESAQLLALSTPTHSSTISEDARRLLQKTGDTISKPLSTIGRIFSEVLDGAESKLSSLPGPFGPFELSREQQADGQNAQKESRLLQTPAPVGSSAAHGPLIQTPYKARVRKIPPHSQSPSPSGSPFSSAFPDDTPSRAPRQGPMTHQPLALGPSQPFIPSLPPHHSPSPFNFPERSMHYQAPPLLPPRVQSLVAEEGLGGDASNISRTPTPNLDLIGVQEQIDAAHANAAAAARDTLIQIFPGTDVEVIEWVLEANGGDLGKSLEALLEMNP
ncbi:hypothetical protein APHAL10511_005232 [Amanita phalloides]|nr:hypothetical protein APHAL10511_005232 [Amanita phalloides]